MSKDTRKIARLREAITDIIYGSAQGDYIPPRIVLPKRTINQLIKLFKETHKEWKG